MSRVFLHLLNQSLTASVLILAVIGLRFLFRKLPKSPQCLLWALVALRLAVPFSLESAWSLIPKAEPIPAEVVFSAPAPERERVFQPGEVTPAVEETPVTPTAPTVDYWQIASIVWLAGVAGLLAAGLLSYFRLKQKLRVSLRLRDNIYLCDGISGPFVLGLVRPKIYIPSQLDALSQSFVLAHEQAHLKHKDPWWKLIGYLLVCVYWFQPMVWLAWWLFCRDLEMGCDERAVKDMTAIQRKTYACVLLQCAAPKQYRFPCPVAFSQNSVKSRIKNVLTHKKTKLWLLGGAAVLAVVVCSLFVTTRKTVSQLQEVNQYLPEGYFLFSDNPYEAALIQEDTSDQVGGIQGTLLNGNTSANPQAAFDMLGYNMSTAEWVGGDTEWTIREKDGNLCYHSLYYFSDSVYDIWFTEEFYSQDDSNMVAMLKESLQAYIQGNNSLDLNQRPFDQRSSARGAAVYDLSTGKTLYAKNYWGETSPGGWCRVAFAAAILAQNPDLETVFPIPSWKEVSFSDSVHLEDYQNFTLRDHLYSFLLGSTIPSSDVSSWVLTHNLAKDEEEAAAMMRQWLESIGCTHTYFDNVSACYSDDAHTTVEDIVTMLKAALENETFREIWSTATYQLPGQELPLYSRNYLMPDNPVKPEFVDSQVTGGIGYMIGFADLAITAGRNGRYLCVIQNADRVFQENGWTVDYWGSLEEMKLLMDMEL